MRDPAAIEGTFFVGYGGGQATVEANFKRIDERLVRGNNGVVGVLRFVHDAVFLVEHLLLKLREVALAARKAALQTLGTI